MLLQLLESSVSILLVPAISRNISYASGAQRKTRVIRVVYTIETGIVLESACNRLGIDLGSVQDGFGIGLTSFCMRFGTTLRQDL